MNHDFVNPNYHWISTWDPMLPFDLSGINMICLIIRKDVGHFLCAYIQITFVTCQDLAYNLTSPASLYNLTKSVTDPFC